MLPSSVLARSDWSNAAVASHSSPFAVMAAILKNLNANLNSFGAAQMLGGLALGAAWLGSGIFTELSRRPLAKSARSTL